MKNFDQKKSINLLKYFKKVWLNLYFCVRNIIVHSVCT